MKIICSDYDGTLNHGGITEEKLSAIKKWQDAGNLFCVVSGRQKEFFSQLRKNNIPVDFLLACNGAVIADKDNIIVSDIRCNEDIANELIEFVFSMDCSFALFCGDEFIRLRSSDYPEKPGIEYDPCKKLGSFSQISTACDTFENAADAVEKIRERFGEFLNPLQNGTCIDIVPAGMDKAQGIYKLLQFVGAVKEDVIAVGDNVNDMAMIEEFYSYAMANGVDSIKAAADKETSGIEELIMRETDKTC